MLNNGVFFGYGHRQSGQINLGHALPLFIAIILSALLHLYLIHTQLSDVFSIFNNSNKSQPKPIQAELVLKKTPLKKIAAPIPPPKKVMPVKKTVNPKPIAKKLAAAPLKHPIPILALPSIAPSDTFALPPLTNQPIALVAIDDKNLVAVTETDVANTVIASTDTVTFEGDDPLPMPYQMVESHYDVYVDPASNTNRSAAGEATMIFSSNGSHYQLKSIIEPHGIIALFIPDLVQTSEGDIGVNGLQPKQYLHQFGSKKSKMRKAEFDWSNNVLTMHTKDGVQTATVEAGAQDLLSFMYQFMFVPPLDRMAMTVTNGRKVSTYQYSFEGEEIIKTKLGAIKTLHILRSDDDQEDKTELWLAVNYRYLPVKIKKTEKKKHRIYELVVRRIKTDQGELIGNDALDGLAIDHTAANHADTENDHNNEKTTNTNKTPTQLNPFLNR